MKQSKLLLISTLSALVLTILSLPVTAKAPIKYHLIHLQHSQPSETAIRLRSSLYDQLNNYKPLINTRELTNSYPKKLSGTFILNIRPVYQEIRNIDVLTKTYPDSFFETTMIFNDKLQQFLSLFTSQNSDDNNHIQDTDCEI